MVCKDSSGEIGVKALSGYGRNVAVYDFSTLPTSFQFVQDGRGGGNYSRVIHHLSQAKYLGIVDDRLHECSKKVAGTQDGNM